MIKNPRASHPLPDSAPAPEKKKIRHTVLTRRF